MEANWILAESAGDSLLGIWEGYLPPAPFWYFAQRAAEFQACLARLDRIEAESWEEALSTAMGVTVEWLRGLAIVGCRVLEQNGPDYIIGIAFDEDGLDEMDEAQSDLDRYWEEDLIACADRLGPMVPLYPRLEKIYSKYLPLPVPKGGGRSPSIRA